jgi:hypothetical protein
VAAVGNCKSTPFQGANGAGALQGVWPILVHRDLEGSGPSLPQGIVSQHLFRAPTGAAPSRGWSIVARRDLEGLGFAVRRWEFGVWGGLLLISVFCLLPSAFCPHWTIVGTARNTSCDDNGSKAGDQAPSKDNSKTQSTLVYRNSAGCSSFDLPSCAREECRQPEDK